MQPGARKRASGLVGLLRTPFRARSRIVDKLGPRWAILADSLIVGGALGLIAALALDVSGETKLGIFAGSLALAGIAGVALGLRRKASSDQQDNTQP
jgi:hypothetical protein